MIQYVDGYVCVPKSVGGAISTAALAAHSEAFGDTEWVYVPHTVSASRRLIASGIDVISPIATDYAFKYINKGVSHTPMDHQIATADFAVLEGSCFILNDPGTGKTTALLWAWHYLRQRGLAKRLMIFAPISVMYDAWVQDIMRTMPQVSVAFCRGSAQARAAAIHSTADIVITNHHAIKHTIELFNDKQVSHVIIDEASAFSNPHTDLFKHMRKYVAGKTCWVVTATPVTQGPERAWALCQFVDPSTVPDRYTKWRDEVCVKHGQFGYRPRAGSAAKAHAAMQPAIRFRKDECMQLPPVSYLDRHIPMSPDQIKFITKMRNDWLYEDAGVTVTAVNAGVRVLKMLQACMGSVYQDDGTSLALPGNARMQEIVDICLETEGKLVVFVPSIPAMKRLAAYLEKHLYKGVCEMVWGDVGINKRRDIINRFQDANETNFNILLAHPETMAHGVTLTAANAVVWYAPYPKPEYYIQGNERTNRPGQVRNQTIYHLSGGPVEDHVYATIAGKVGAQVDILKLYEQMTTARLKPKDALA